MKESGYSLPDMTAKSRKSEKASEIALFLEEHLDSLVKLELVAFLDANPGTIDTAESLAIWIGAEPAQLELEASELVAAGLLERHGEGEGAVFTLTPDSEVRKLISQATAAYQAAKSSMEKQRIELEAERARIAARARLLETQLEAIVDLMPDGLVVTNSSNQMVIANDFACRLLGIDAPKAGRPVAQELIKDKKLLAVIATGNLPENRVLQIGETFVQAGVEDIGGSNGSWLGRVVVFTDVTELERLSRMKSEAVSFVSHELKSPLTTLKFVASSILDQRLEGARQAQFLQMMMDEVDRLTQMINGFLDLSQIESGKSLRLNITSFDLDALLDHFVERHSLYANEHILVYEVAEEAKGLHIEADEPRIQLVITNLVTNAIKYSPSNTTVTVRLLLEGDEARVEVEDQGFGIGESDLAKVFEPYFRTESARKKKGTGLGLPLVKKLVEHHGGRITLRSKEGEGSTFSVWLPVRHSDKEQQPEG